MVAEGQTRKRFFLAFLLFVLSAISFLDRTNVSIAGLQISSEYGLGNQHLGWIFSAFLIGYAGFQVPAGWLASFTPLRLGAESDPLRSRTRRLPMTPSSRLKTNPSCQGRWSIQKVCLT